MVKFNEAIAHLRERLGISDEEWEAILREVDLAARARAADMSRAMHRDLLQSILEAIEEGTTAETFRKDFDAIAARHGWKGDNTAGYRSTLIFRTQTAQAMAAGRWRQIVKDTERRPFIRYITAGDHRVRPAHAAWHGVILRYDDPWWKTHFPPNGFQCRCHVQSVGSAELERWGWTVSEQAPPINPVIKFVKQDGINVPIEVPAGIDPGFAYNVGERGLNLADNR